MWQQLVTVALFGALLYRADALTVSGKRCSRISWAHLAFLCAISLCCTSRASQHNFCFGVQTVIHLPHAVSATSRSASDEWH
jgi:hypothetical protein